MRVPFYREPSCVRDPGSCLWLAVALLSLGVGSGQAQTFVRVDAGIYNDSGISAGASLGDYDNDGHLDLFVANWNDQHDFLYHNNGDGTFARITDSPIVAEKGFSSGGSWGDYDNDGHLDLFVANQQDEHNCLFHNNGDGTFTKVRDGDIVTDYGNSYSGAWSDYDRDGHLDLHVANASQPNFLYHNDGDGTFTRVKTGAIATDLAINWTSVWADCDHDGFPDLFVPSVGQNNLLYRNNRDGTFTSITEGEVVNDGGLSYGSTWGDFDGDGHLDLFVANFTADGEVQNGLYRNRGDGAFLKVREGDIVNPGATPFAATWDDYDNDGDLDLFEGIWGEASQLYLNGGDGRFSRATEGAAVTLVGFPSGHASADYDNDGRIDLLLANWDNLNNYAFRNTTPTGNWLTVRLRGTRSNRFGVGARITATAPVDGKAAAQVRELKTNDGLRSQGGNRVHFGLGGAPVVTALRIEWPSGHVDELSGIETNALVTITEGGGLERDEPEAAVLPREGIADLLHDVITEDGKDAAIARYAALRRDHADEYDFDESQLNLLGYRLLGEGNSESAIAMFRLNLEEHPGSVNSHDSLAEAHAATGDADSAARAYRALLTFLAESETVDEATRVRFERRAGYFLKNHGE